MPQYPVVDSVTFLPLQASFVFGYDVHSMQYAREWAQSLLYGRTDDYVCGLVDVSGVPCWYMCMGVYDAANAVMHNADCYLLVVDTQFTSASAAYSGTVSLQGQSVGTDTALLTLSGTDSGTITRQDCTYTYQVGYAHFDTASLDFDGNTVYSSFGNPVLERGENFATTTQNLLPFGIIFVLLSVVCTHVLRKFG